MNYAPITTDPADIRLPRTLAGTPADPVLTLVCTADRQHYDIPVAEFSVDGQYYAMRADFSEVKTPGEYEYRLTADGLLLASGIIRFGDAPNPSTESYEITPTYEQYTAD